MKILNVRFWLLFIIFSCNSNKNNNRNLLVLGNEKDTALKKVAQAISKERFFDSCSSLLMSEGGIQVLPNKSKDSTGLLCYLNYYGQEKSYEIILVYKGGVENRKKVGYNLIADIFQKGCANMFEDFDCYSFVLPMLDPEPLLGTNKSNINFPVTVKVFKRLQLDDWEFLNSIKVKSLKDFSELQFTTIYKLK